MQYFQETTLVPAKQRKIRIMSDYSRNPPTAVLGYILDTITGVPYLKNRNK